MKHQPKLFFTLACVASLTLTSSWAQRGRPTGGPPAGFNSERPAGGPPAFAQALPEVYGILEAADADGNNQLDAEERAVLIEAMQDGTLSKPEWVPDAPEGVIATHESVAKKLSDLYTALAPYDADDNGALEGDELSSLRRAFMTGKIRVPFRGAQAAGNGRRGRRPFEPPHGIDADKGRPEGNPPFASAIPEMYANIAAIDTNNDGKLDEAEQDALTAAINDGTLTKPEGLPQPPEGVEISTEDLLQRLSGLYARFSKLDTNDNGKLDEEELEGIRKGIQRPGGSEGRFRNGRPQGRGRPEGATRSNRSGRHPFEGSRPSR